MKRIVLFRHAKTVQINKDTPVDAERPLTDSGRQDATNAGALMREKAYLPDLILCSPSVRTRETLERANAELRSSAPVEYVSAIYNASAGQLLSLVQTLDDRAMQPMLVGHNPGFEEFASMMVNSAGLRAFAAAPGKDRFPPAALVVLEFDTLRWSRIAPQTGALVDFMMPPRNATR